MAKDVKARLSWEGARKFISTSKEAGQAIDSSFEKGKRKVREFETAGKRAATALKGQFTALNSLLGPLGLGLGITGAIFGMKKLIGETIEYRDSIGKASDATGLSVEFLSSMGFAAEQSGSSLQGVQTGLRGLLRQMQGAKDGLGQSVDLFKNLGINALDAGGNLRDAEDVFLDVADAISKMSNETEAAALAQEIFGRSGIELVPLLKQGKEGIAALTYEAHRLDIVLTEEQVKAAAEANDALNRLNKTIGAIVQNIVADAVPAITTFSGVLTQMLIEQKKEDSIFNKLKENSDKIGRFFISINPLLKAYMDTLKEAREIGAAPPVPIVPFDFIHEEDPLPSMEKLIEFQKKVSKPVAPIIPDVPALAAATDEYIEQNEQLFTIEQMQEAYNAQLDISRGKLADVVNAVAPIGAEIAEAVFQGERFVKTLERVAKQLAKRVFAGLIGGGLGFLFGGPAGFATGFKAASGFAAGGSPPIGQRVRVGEHGAEDVVFNRPVRIRPAHESGNATEVNFSMTVHTQKLDMETLEFELMPRMRRLLIERFGKPAF